MMVEDAADILWQLGHSASFLLVCNQAHDAAQRVFAAAALAAERGFAGQSEKSLAARAALSGSCDYQRSKC